MKRKTKKLTAEIIQKVYRNNVAEIKSIVHKDELEFKDNDGRTLLFHAIYAKNEELIKWILDQGVDINLKDKIGWTPLHYAAQEYLIGISKILIEKGADVNAQDMNGNTVLWRATFASMGKGEIIKVLLEKGAIPEIKNNYGISAIDLAENIGNYDVKQFFN